MADKRLYQLDQLAVASSYHSPPDHRPPVTLMSVAGHHNPGPLHVKYHTPENKSTQVLLVKYVHFQYLQ